MELTVRQLDVLEAAERGVPRHVHPNVDELCRDLEARGLMRRTAESWFATDDGGRALVAAGRKARHLTIQSWGRAARRPPGGAA